MNRADDSLARLFTDHSRRLTYERGDTIIRAGDTPSGVYLLTDGWVKVYSLCRNGEPNIIMGLTAGDIFPLTWAIAGSLRDISFAALDDTRVLRVSREHFLQALRTDTRVSEAVLSKLVDYFHRMSDELEGLPYRSARERVAFRLISLASDFGKARSDKVRLELRIPNEYIARSSNMTRETASREISWLARKQIIQHRNGHIIINDLAALEKEAGKSLGLP